jgi:type IV secretion system protein VirB5
MFKRPSVRYGRTPEPITPYQRAQQAWDDRIGSARVQARNWRLMAFGELFLVAGLSSALVWQGARGSIVPWVVQVDRLGQAQAVEPAVAAYRPTDPRSRGTSPASSSRSARSRPTRSCSARTGCALRLHDDRGAMALNDYARINDPFARVGQTQVAVEVSSVIRASADSFRIAWVERRYEQGQLAATSAGARSSPS